MGSNAPMDAGQTKSILFDHLHVVHIFVFTGGDGPNNQEVRVSPRDPSDIPGSDPHPHIHGDYKSYPFQLKPLLTAWLGPTGTFFVKETITKKIEIPMDTLYELVDNLTSELRIEDTGEEFML